MERAAAAAILGRRTRITADEQRDLAALVESDPDARVRSVALGALVHAAPRRTAARAWRVAARDTDRNVRRRVAELAPALGARLRHERCSRSSPTTSPSLPKPRPSPWENTRARHRA